MQQSEYDTQYNTSQSGKDVSYMYTPAQYQQIGSSVEVQTTDFIEGQPHSSVYLMPATEQNPLETENLEPIHSSQNGNDASNIYTSTPSQPVVSLAEVRMTDFIEGEPHSSVDLMLAIAQNPLATENFDADLSGRYFLFRFIQVIQNIMIKKNLQQQFLKQVGKKVLCSRKTNLKWYA